MTSTKCSACGLVNWSSAENCKRCGAALGAGHDQLSPGSGRSEEEKARIRQSALKKMKAGAGVFVLFIVALVAIPLTGRKFYFHPVGWVLMLTPVAGVLQLVTKTPFEELSERWDNLAWWQRGLIGISVFVGGLLSFWPLLS